MIVDFFFFKFFCNFISKCKKYLVLLSIDFTMCAVDHIETLKSLESEVKKNPLLLSQQATKAFQQQRERSSTKSI